MYRFSFTQYSYSKHMAESTNLALLLTRHGHIIAGTEEEMMSMDADTKEQVR